MTLQDGLKRARKTFKTTQKTAAKAAGVSEVQYQFYEYGRNDPSTSALIALADFYDCSVDYLIGRSDTPERR